MGKFFLLERFAEFCLLFVFLFSSAGWGVGG